MEKVTKRRLKIKFMVIHFSWALITDWRPYTVLLVDLLSISQDNFMPYFFKLHIPLLHTPLLMTLVFTEEIETIRC